jgi:hypothetical protein
MISESSNFVLNFYECALLKIAGNSAGGLAVLLGVDHIAQSIKAVNINNNVKVTGLVDSSYFMKYTSGSSWEQQTYYNQAIVGENLDYKQAMMNVFNFMKVSAGANTQCIASYNINGSSSSSSLCMFAETLIPHITTPLFFYQVSEYFISNIMQNVFYINSLFI